MDNKDNRNHKRPSGSWKPLVIMLVLSVLLTLLFWGTLQRFKQGTVEQIKYSQFMDMLENHEIKSIEISDTSIVIHPKSRSELKEEMGEDYEDSTAAKTYETTIGKVTYTTYRVYDIYLIDKLEDADVEYEEMKDTSNAWWVSVLQFVLMLGAIYLVMSLIMRALTKNSGVGGIMSVGKSKAKVYVENETGVTFADVAGQEEAKESLVEMVDFLHNPKRYLDIGAKLPRGALLVGPPGTGKTLLAKAVAGEAHVPFFSLSGSDFVEMYVGVGASRVRDLFRDANNAAPCIIFIDEIDAIGRSRDTVGRGGDSEREQTLNQLLSEMDGFDTSKGIVILAATNRPEVLDKALLRPGRFDRRVIVEKPDLKGRIDTLKVHAKNVRMDETVDFDELALATAGAVGADLANIINEAALLAVKNGRGAVSQKDLFESVEVVFAGKEKKDRILSKHEKKVVAYHEIGHALIIALQKHTEPVQKITIIPRTMGALGYVMQVPEEEKYLRNKEEMLADLVVDMGGRAAEELKFDSVTTGASNDIEKATALARSMITLYGMSDKFGTVALESVQNRYLDGRRVLNCSEETATEIDKEVQKMVRQAYKQAYKLLKEHEALLDKLAAYLIKKETITGKEFMAIFNKEMGIKVKKPKKDKSAMPEAFPPAAATPAGQKLYMELKKREKKETDPSAKESATPTQDTDPKKSEQTDKENDSKKE